MDKQLKINKEALLKLGDYSLEFRSCYFFIKKLSSIPHHPIITDYPNKTKMFSKLMNISEKRFISKMQQAFSYGLITQEGNTSVRLISLNSELRYFGLTESKIIKTTPNQLKELYHQEVLKNNLKKQKQALFFKKRQNNSKNSRLSSSVRPVDKASVPNMKRSANEDLTLSVRNVCKLLGYKSTGTAYSVLKRLTKQNILKRTNNILEIKKETYYFIRDFDSKHLVNIRYSIAKDKYYYQGANIYEIVRNKAVNVTKSTPLTSDFKRDFSIPVIGSSYLYLNL